MPPDQPTEGPPPPGTPPAPPTAGYGPPPTAEYGPPFYLGPYPPPYHGYVPPGPRYAVPPELVASRVRRVLAKLVDLLLIAVFVVIGGLVMTAVVDGRDEPPVWAVVVTVSLYVLALIFGIFLYEPLFDAKGGTLGKRLLGVRVVSLETGRPLGTGAAFGRHLMGMGIGLGTVVLISYLWFLWDWPYRQCLHDKLLRAVVIRPPSTAPPAAPPPVPPTAGTYPAH